MLRFLCIASALVLTFASVAKAEQPKILSESGDWTAWTYNEGSNLICYMSSTPKKDEGKYTKRGDIYVIITHRPAENRLMKSVLLPVTSLNRVHR